MTIDTEGGVKGGHIRYLTLANFQTHDVVVTALSTLCSAACFFLYSYCKTRFACAISVSSWICYACMCARPLFCTCACVVVGVSTAALLGRWFHRYYTATVCGDISGLIHNLAHNLHQFQALWQTFTCTFLPKCRQHARHTHSHSPIALTFPNFCPVTLETETLSIYFTYNGWCPG